MEASRLAIIPITLAETLRPWRAAGLFHFLQDQTLLEGLCAEDVQALLGQQAHTGAPVQTGAGVAADFGKYPHTTGALQGQSIGGEQAPTGNKFTAASHSDPVKDSSSSIASTRVMDIPANPSSMEPEAAKQPAPHAATTAVAATQTEIPLQLDVKQWPTVWQQAFAKAAPAPILWSYAALGEDLGGKANPARGACLRGIIGSLQLPKGTSSFWAPAVLNGQGQLEGNASLFLSGIKLLRPKLVIAIGQDSLTSFAPHVSLTLPFTQELYQGMLVVLLPDFASLISRADLVEKSIIYLRACVSTIPSINLR